jgi:ABC-2 type transport system ATP-binding protein
LRGLPGVNQVTPFGNTLHVTGSDAPLLSASIERFKAATPHRWELIASGLEDVFIHLMDEVSDNFG